MDLKASNATIKHKVKKAFKTDIVHVSVVDIKRPNSQTNLKLKQPKIGTP